MRVVDTMSFKPGIQGNRPKHMVSFLSGRPGYLLLVLVFSFFFAFAALAENVRPAKKILRIRILVVFYPNTYSLQSGETRAKAFHESLFKVVHWYDAALKGKAALRLTFVQIERTLSAQEIRHDSKGGVFFEPNEILKKDLRRVGLAAVNFDAVWLFYAFKNNVKPWNTYQQYGGGERGPKGIRILDDKREMAFCSVSLFTWGDHLNAALHEFTHALDAMFGCCHMPSAMLHGDEMAKNIPALLKARPGAFLPNVSDAEILSRAKKGGAFKWWEQLIYYKWLMDGPSPEEWQRLYPTFGEVGTEEDSAVVVRPLFHTYHVSPGSSIYLPVVVSDTLGKPAARAKVRAFWNGKWVDVPRERSSQFGLPHYAIQLKASVRQPARVEIAVRQGLRHARSMVDVVPVSRLAFEVEGGLALETSTPLLPVKVRIIREGSHEVWQESVRILAEIFPYKGELPGHEKAETKIQLARMGDRYEGRISLKRPGRYTIKLRAISSPGRIPDTYLTAIRR